MGIPVEDLPFIFDRFWRGDRSRSDRTHSGLGLAITRQLVQAHGGTIEVKSEGVAGKGTTFVIDLPM
jgi:two-component system sensor histidine kinase BaeS